MKLERIQKELTKTKDKISALQNRLKDLEKQQTEIENTSILAVVRSVNITHQELIDIIQAFKAQGAGAQSKLDSYAKPEDEMLYGDDPDLQDDYGQNEYEDQEVFDNEDI